jgi:hypothetical protein
MTAEAWCNLIKNNNISNTELEHNRNKLIEALGSKRYDDLKMQMEADQVTSDHIAVFSIKYRPKNKPTYYCLYASTRSKGR